MGSVLRLKRRQRKRLIRMVQRGRDAGQVRRAQAMLFLDEGLSVAETARRVKAARSTMYRWIHWFESGGESALRWEHPGRASWTVTDAVAGLIEQVVMEEPSTQGYLRSTWTSEMLARVVHRTLGVQIHASTVRRLLPRLGFGWRRSRPTLCKRDPRKSEKLSAIQHAIETRESHTEVFYVDEADVDLNPRMGHLWTPTATQWAIPTPGNNEKRYLAGALHAHTGKLVYVEADRKDSELFVRLLLALRRQYRRARRIVLIVDNYIIHKSRLTKTFLANNPKFELLFQPVYHPWVNVIERLWKQLHNTVARNHTWPTLRDLMAAVRRFLDAVQPFPGAGHGVAPLGSPI